MPIDLQPLVLVKRDESCVDPVSGGDFNALYSWLMTDLFKARKMAPKVTVLSTDRAVVDTIVESAAHWSSNSYKATKIAYTSNVYIPDGSFTYRNYYDVQYYSDATMRQLANTTYHDALFFNIKFEGDWCVVAAAIYCAVAIVRPGGSVCVIVDGDNKFADHIYHHMTPVVYAAYILLTKLGEATIWTIDNSIYICARGCKSGSDFSAKAYRILQNHLHSAKVDTASFVKFEFAKY